MTSAQAQSGVVVLSLPEEFDAMTSVDVRRRISETLDQMAVDTLVLDLTDTKFIDSTGLGTLVIARNLTNAREMALRLRKPGTEVRSVLDRSGMTGIFDFED